MTPNDLDLAPEAPAAAAGVPVIDVAELAHGINPRVTHEIASACETWGFFQVVNHGIEASLCDEVWARTRWFFAQPADAKESLLRTRDNPWGYYNNELTKNQRDRKEVFDLTDDGVDPIYAASNRWPTGNDGQRFRRTLSEYRDACRSLSLRLLDAMTAGLDVDPIEIRRCFDPHHTGFLRLNYYPVADPLVGRSDVPHLPEADRGVHHHTDAGGLTVLMQDNVGGLQVYRDGLWHGVPSLPGALVINTGDMLQVWSNDRYRAAMHRVVAMRQTDRYSLPFFFNPAAGTIVEPLAPLIGADRPSRYRAIDWSEFRFRRTDGDYADVGEEVQIAQYRRGEGRSNPAAAQPSH